MNNRHDRQREQDGLPVSDKGDCFAQAARTKRPAAQSGRDIDSPRSGSRHWDRRETHHSTGTKLVRSAGSMRTHARGALDLELGASMAPALLVLERVLHRHAVRTKHLGPSKSTAWSSREADHSQSKDHHHACVRDRTQRRRLLERVDRHSGCVLRPTYLVREGA